MPMAISISAAVAPFACGGADGSAGGAISTTTGAKLAVGT